MHVIHFGFMRKFLMRQNYQKYYKCYYFPCCSSFACYFSTGRYCWIPFHIVFGLITSVLYSSCKYNGIRRNRSCILKKEPALKEAAMYNLEKRMHRVLIEPELEVQTRCRTITWYSLIFILFDVVAAMIDSDNKMKLFYLVELVCLTAARSVCRKDFRCSVCGFICYMLYPLLKMNASLLLRTFLSCPHICTWFLCYRINLVTS